MASTASPSTAWPRTGAPPAPGPHSPLDTPGRIAGARPIRLVATTSTPSPRISPLLTGQIAGLVAVASWGGYLAFSRAGINAGLHVADILFLRYATAGLLMLPFIILRAKALRALGPRRAIAITAAAGPPFIILSVGGYNFASLAHGAVLQPVTVTLVVTIAAALFMAEPLTRQRLAAMLIAITGVAMIGLGAPTTSTGSAPTWIGDLLFIGAGLLYATFTIMLRAWRIDPVLATGVITVLSAAIVVPAFIASQDFSRILALPPATLAAQVMVQGIISGILAVLAFGITVKHLGAARAALFPSMVPVAATLIGIPITHELPTIIQAAGLAIATTGLLIAVIPRRTLPR